MARESRKTGSIPPQNGLDSGSFTPRVALTIPEAGRGGRSDGASVEPLTLDPAVGGTGNAEAGDARGSDEDTFAGDASEGGSSDPFEDGVWTPPARGASSASEAGGHSPSGDATHRPIGTASNTDLRAQLERFLALFEHAAGQSGDDAPRSDDT